MTPPNSGGLKRAPFFQQSSNPPRRGFQARANLYCSPARSESRHRAQRLRAATGAVLWRSLKLMKEEIGTTTERLTRRHFMKCGAGSTSIRSGCGTAYYSPLDGQSRVASLHDKLVGDTRQLLFILLGAVSLAVTVRRFIAVVSVVC